jgi:hypothetical protein
MPHELLDERLIGPFIRDLGALMHASTVLVGDRLGLYKAMADCKWLSPEELAARTETDTRYVAECWRPRRRLATPSTTRPLSASGCRRSRRSC